MEGEAAGAIENVGVLNESACPMESARPSHEPQ